MKETSLPVYESHEKGDPYKYKKTGTFNDYGFKCGVSSGSWDDLDDQIQDACSFLTDHFDEIKRLVNQYDIDDIMLDFPVTNQLMKHDLFNHLDYIPPSILKLVGELGVGIGVTQYRPSTEEK